MRPEGGLGAETKARREILTTLTSLRKTRATLRAFVV